MGVISLEENKREKRGRRKDMRKTETEPEFKREKDRETVTGRARYKEEWKKKQTQRREGRGKYPERQGIGRVEKKEEE